MTHEDLPAKHQLATSQAASVSDTILYVIILFIVIKYIHYYIHYVCRRTLSNSWLHPKRSLSSLKPLAISNIFIHNKLLFIIFFLIF